jgi:hypothetical protein
MYVTKLHTRQYAGAQLLRPLRAERTKITHRHTTRAIAAVVMVGAAAWCGSGIAHADNNHERQACTLMDDSASAISMGYGESTMQYAFAVLSTEMPSVDAAHVLLAATRDDCPNHAGDLPDNWQ